MSECSNCTQIAKGIQSNISHGNIPDPGYGVSCVKCKHLTFVSNSGPGYAGMIVSSQETIDVYGELLQIVGANSD